MTMQLEAIISLLTLLLDYYSPALQASQKKMLLRNPLLFRMGIVKSLLGLMFMGQVINFKHISYSIESCNVRNILLCVKKEP